MAEMKVFRNWRPIVAGLPSENHFDSHSSDDFVRVVYDNHLKSVEPVVVIIEWFADFDVCLFLILDSDNFDRLYAPRLPCHGSILLWRSQSSRRGRASGNS
jgi:hypothetical protein